MNKIIDLRSDTVTKPCKYMYAAISKASKDDVFLDDDSSTKKLELECADLFGFEDSVFVVSGTMANQLAVKVHTKPGECVVTDYSYHVNYYEAAGIASITSTQIHAMKTLDGLISVEDLSSLLSDRNNSKYNNNLKLLCLENTINYHGGKIFPIKKLEEVSKFAHQTGLLVHLDGARIFNSIIEEGIKANSYTVVADSMMLTFTKGLGAPFGAVLLGKNDFITEARKYNKWYGGGMHQSGLMAECALYAIKNNIVRIKEDNMKAKRLANLLLEKEIPGITISKVETNIVMIDFSSIGIQANKFITRLLSKNIKLYLWSKYVARAVMHKDVSLQDIDFIAEEISYEMKYVLKFSQKYMLKLL